MKTWFAVAMLIGLSAAGARGGEDAVVSLLDEEMIVTTTRIERELGRTASTVSVVGGAELAARQIEQASDAVRSVPGAYPAGGSPGAPVSLYLRGTASNQNVVLLDGVQVNDPTIGGQFNWFDLGILNIDRIEILRGAASTLYGSEGAGGVVSLVTRRGGGEPLVRLGVEGGSYGHYRGSLLGQGALGELDFSLAASHSRWHNGLKRQEYSSDSLAGRLGVVLAEGSDLSIVGRYVDSAAEDPWDFPFSRQIEEDGNIERTRRTGLVGVVLDQEMSPALGIRLAGSLFDASSLFTNGPDAAGDPLELRSRAKAQVRNITLTGTARIPGIAEGLDGTFVAGLEYEDEISESRVKSAYGPSPPLDETTRNRAAFVLAEFVLLDRLTLGGGLRRDRNSFFDYETTAAASALLRLESSGTKIRANYGEAFRGPKPVEFADPWIGNPDLGPESSVSLDIGVDQELLSGAVVLGVAWYQVRTRDLIAYDFGTFRLENMARARVRGFEFQAAAEPVDGLQVRGWLTLQDPRNLSAGPGEERRLPGRAKRFGGGEIAYRGEGWEAGVEVHASDDYPGQGRITPDGVMRSHPGRKLLITIRGEVEVTRGVRLYGRLENLLDKEWYDADERPDGLGRGLYFGVDVDL